MRASLATFLAPVLLVLAAGLPAQAAITVDLVFRDTTAQTLTIDPGDPAGGGSRTMDIVLRSTYDLVGFGVSVAYDYDNGLAVAGIDNWRGVGVDFNMAGEAIRCCSPAVNPADLGSLGVRGFGCVTPSSGTLPEQMLTGTYNIGTIIWDTSAIAEGAETISAFLAPADGFAAVIGGAYVNVDSGELGTLTVTTEPLPPPPPNAVIPEPGAAALMAVGFVVFTLAAPRRRPG